MLSLTSFNTMLTWICNEIYIDLLKWMHSLELQTKFILKISSY
jgi:hypothetical protein